MRWKLIIAGAAVLVGLGGGLTYWYFRHFNGEELRLPGVVEIQEVRLGSKIGGRIAEIKTAEGKTVEAGDTLVVFYVPELKAQRDQLAARLASAEAEWHKIMEGPRKEEREAALAAYQAAKARWNRMEKGAREEEKDQARLEVKSSEADYNLAQEEFDRVSKLSQEKIVTRSDFDAALATLERTRSRLNLNKSKLAMMLAGNRQEDRDEAKADMERFKANYELLEAGSRQEDKDEAKARRDEARAKLDEIEANLAEKDIKAPARALIEVLSVRQGDLIPPNTPVIRILYVDDLWVKVYIPETELGKITLGQAVKVTVDSYPDKELGGEIIQIYAASEYTPRNVQSADERKHQVFGIKVKVDDPHGIIKSGMAAEVRIPLKRPGG